MGEANEFYLVRHGSYDRHTRRLDEAGRIFHAPSARDNLLARGLGASTILLSSDAPRAAETAEIIGEGIGIEPVLCDIINEAGNNPWVIKDLDFLINNALDEMDVTYDGTQELVVVTHAPMLAIARGVESQDISFGEVFAYQRGSWANPYAPK
jgi:phosphohistidine phosphatase SixA